jgi:hypothetical protein
MTVLRAFGSSGSSDNAVFPSEVGSPTLGHAVKP